MMTKTPRKQRTFTHKTGGEKIQVLKPSFKLVAGEVLTGFECKVLASGVKIFITAGRLQRDFK